MLNEIVILIINTTCHNKYYSFIALMVVIFQNRTHLGNSLSFSVLYTRALLNPKREVLSAHSLCDAD